MKITVINGQSHKGSSYEIGQLFVSSISGNNEISEFFLPSDLNHFCSGCMACVEEREKCPFWADKKPIIDAILAADILVITSPTYCMMPSAPLKAFFDLFFTNWMAHRPYAQMFSKKAMVITTAAGSGSGKAAKLIKENLTNWGIPKVTTYGVNIHAVDLKTAPPKIMKKIFQTIKFYAKAYSSTKPVKPSFKTKFMFKALASMQQANWGASKAEAAYWKENGWLDGKYPW